MTSHSKSISDWLAPSLLVIGVLLAAWNWVLQPDRTIVWAVVMLLFGCMTWALRVAMRRSNVNDEEARRRTELSHKDQSLKDGVVVAGLIMVLCLGGVLAKKLGMSGDSNLSWRGTMIILGVFFAVTGNTIPKVLPSMSSLRHDAATVQACRRFAGWTWVLTGVAFTACWLVLPVEKAQPLSLALLIGGMIAILGQMIRLRLSRQKEA
jgi:hypothetical protein